MHTTIRYQGDIFRPSRKNLGCILGTSWRHLWDILWTSLLNIGVMSGTSYENLEDILRNSWKISLENPRTFWYIFGKSIFELQCTALLLTSETPWELKKVIECILKPFFQQQKLHFIFDIINKSAKNSWSYWTFKIHSHKNDIEYSIVLIEVSGLFPPLLEGKMYNNCFFLQFKVFTVVY